MCTTTSVVVSTFKHRLSAVSYTSKHHLFNDGILEDWLEPSEHRRRIVCRRWERIIAGDIFVRTVSTAEPQEGAHGHASGIGDATCTAGPCSFDASGPIATARREG